MDAAEIRWDERATPSLESAHELAAGGYNTIPLTHTFVDDCETPVSAFLKLREAGPSFLLESAEQGRSVGRYAFLGFRPRTVSSDRVAVTVPGSARGAPIRICARKGPTGGGALSEALAGELATYADARRQHAARRTHWRRASHRRAGSR